MTAQELQIKLDKALETVSKKEATIERHKAQAEKKLQLIKANGWEQGITDFEYQRADNERYWLICEYQSKLRDIKDSTKKLEEAQQIADNWRAKLQRQFDIEMKLASEVPEAFKEARVELVERWTESDIRRRDMMLERKKELSHEEFRKMYRYTEEEALHHTDEEFRHIEEIEANYWLLNLYNRVKEITGDITDCSYLHWGGKCLDGYVVGKDGRAEVETIGAGGYNIQRYHLRVLVKKMK